MENMEPDSNFYYICDCDMCGKTTRVSEIGLCKSCEDSLETSNDELPF
tara:strand:- start:61 stop:204 length:144 start_codon:yes stop_codon:yes gene_type:complete